MKTITYLWLYLAELLLEWKIFKTNVVDKIKTHSIFNNLFKNIVKFLDNVEKYGTARHCCFSTATMVTRTRLNVTFTRTFSPLFFSRVPLSQNKTRTRGSGFTVKLMKFMLQAP